MSAIYTELLPLKNKGKKLSGLSCKVKFHLCFFQRNLSKNPIVFWNLNTVLFKKFTAILVAYFRAQRHFCVFNRGLLTSTLKRVLIFRIGCKPSLWQVCEPSKLMDFFAENFALQAGGLVVFVEGQRNKAFVLLCCSLTLTLRGEIIME